MFHLKTRDDELESSNKGISNAQLDQVSASRDISDTNFTNGSIHYKWNIPNGKWWVPGRSYLRLRCSLTLGDGNALLSTDETASAENCFANLFQSAEFQMNGKTVSRISSYLPQVSALQTRMDKSKSWIDTIGAASNSWGTFDTRKAKNVADQSFELLWTPPLSIFDHEGAIPGNADCELILQPATSSSFQKLFVETALTKGDVNAGSDANTYKLKVVDMFMYTQMYEGPRVSNTTYLLDLKQARLQTSQVLTANSSQYTFEVSPSTHALTFCIQDSRVGSHSAMPVGRFKSFNTAGAATTDLALKTFEISYAGRRYPSPNQSLTVAAGTNFAVQAYINSLQQTGSYFGDGGSETLEDFQRRGAYYHFNVPRDSGDSSTRVVITCEFANLTQIGNCRILCFDHSRQVGSIEMSEGKVRSVELQDA